MALLCTVLKKILANELDILIVSDGEYITDIVIGEDNIGDFINSNHPIFASAPVLEAAEQQITEYFEGKRKKFTLPINPRIFDNSKFSGRVLQYVANIPYGETRSYAEIAKACGNAKACRAVGAVNRGNPLPLLIPCHRVIGKNGELTGYMGKRTDIKQYLLELEQVNKGISQC